MRKGLTNTTKKNNKDSNLTEVEKSSMIKLRFEDIIKEADSNFPALPGFYEKTD